MSNDLTFDLSSVPKEWLIIPCGVFFKEKSIKNTEGEMNLSVYRDYGVIPKDSRDDNHNRVSEDTSNYKLVEPGDFVLNKMKGWSGSLGVSNYRGIVSPSYTVLEPVREIYNKYFHYLLRSEAYRQMYESLSYGVRIGQWELHYHDFKQIPSLYPPIDEQKLIAQYLDKKTEQIDQLVEKIQKKIELIKEQRTSLINHYVTKGLDPKVEMKDSGSEWIGDIPKHWNISKFKYVSSLYSGNSLNENQKIKFQSENSEDIPYISSKDIDSVLQNINYDNGLRIPRKNNNFKKAPIGSFLMVIEGGSAGKKIAYLEQEVCFVNKLCAFDSSENTKFQYYFVQSRIFQNKFKSLISGLIGGVSISNLKNIELILPSLQEQNDIVNVLDEKTKKIDLLIKMENNRISLLTEHRKSLVSTVVKGEYKINEDML
jgi:type I restriction enzyme, S subunit